MNLHDTHQNARGFLIKHLQSGASAEVALGRAMLDHRVEVDGWDGSTWQARSVPTGIAATICRLLAEMDGGAMYVADMCNVSQDALRAVSRMKGLGLVESIGFIKGKGELLMYQDEADAFLRKYDTGQGWLF